ncbi:chemotaxis protein CheW [Sphingomonas sp. 8AM]|uniref:chemotaxis protein CheW n=1 Tax=Sphingomonas sp. 8AM TaxID=2653170 RepID=UPI0012F1E9FB|nr:chemotaxis protein CheW [Sphingomonas sp. 8AM]VXC32233.1 CheW-like domain protein [Sphingomonas sp. 8AM]
MAKTKLSVEAADPPAVSRTPEEHEHDTSRQFVIFHSAGEMFAVPLAEVKEIIRVPDVVRMPLSPPALLGLANLRGTVLPVLDLRRLFNLPAVEVDDASRVVVLDQGQPVGLMVDRMANVVTVDADRVEPVDRVKATIDTDLLTGMIKDADGKTIVMIIDVARTIGRDFAAAAARVAGGQGEVVPLATERDVAGQPEVADEEQLVSFMVDGQEYAFPIGEVQEIVQLPAAITPVPGAPGHVLGVTTLRSRILPLVSLRALFGFDDQALSEANKVVVVSVADGAHDRISVGVVMDMVKAVLRVNRALVEPVPATLGQSGGHGDIRAICRLDEGRRLVSVLGANGMFDLDVLRGLHGDEAAAATTTQEDGFMAIEIVDDAQFVVFRLMDEEYGVPVEAVREIVRVPDQLTRVPRAPDFVEGVINLRGTVLPVIDQRRRFGLDEVERSDRQRIMVFTIDGRDTGFIVDSVSEVRRIATAAISPAPELSGERGRVVQGVANLHEQRRMILLLDMNCLVEPDEDEALSHLEERWAA